MQDYTPGHAGFDDTRINTQYAPDVNRHGALYSYIARQCTRLIDPAAWRPDGACMRAVPPMALMLLAARAQPFANAQAIAVGAFAAGMSAGMSPTALLAGCFIGCVSMGSPALLWPFFGCLCVLLACCVAGVRMTLAGLAISVGVSNIAMVAALSGGDTYVLIMSVVCGIFGASSTLLLSYALNALKASANARGIMLAKPRKGNEGITSVTERLAPEASASSRATVAALAGLLAVTLMGLNGAEIPANGTFPGVSFGFAASLLVTLAASGVSAGAGCGAGVCCWICALPGGGNVSAYAALPAAALITALICGRRGGTRAYSSGARTTRALAFMFICGVCAAMQSSGAARIPYAEMAAAGAVYALIPAAWLAALPGFALAPAGISPELMQQRRVTRQSEEQLSRFAAATAQLADSLEPSPAPEPFDISSYARIELCAGCDKFAACWQSEPASADYAFSELYGHLIEHRTLDDFSLPLKCARGESVTAKLVPYAVNAIASQLCSQELRSMSSTYSQRLRGMANALSDGARSMRFLRGPDIDASGRLYEALYRAGIPCAGVCVEPGTPRLTQIAFQHAPEQTVCAETLHQKALDVAQRVLGYSLEKVEECEYGLLLREVPPISLTYGAARRSSVGHAACGDTFSISETQRGLVLIALADGMGRGQSAAHASENAVSLLENLLCAGLDCDGALRSVNDLLLSDSTRDTYSTLDLSVIDRYNCVLEICKLGAPATYLLRGDTCSPIAGMSPPAGIVESARASHKTVCLQPGDIIVQLTDGVCDTTIPGLQKRMTSELSEFMRRQTAYSRDESPQPLDAQELASKLLAFGSERFGSRDDATVLVSQVSSR